MSIVDCGHHSDINNTVRSPNSVFISLSHRSYQVHTTISKHFRIITMTSQLKNIAIIGVRSLFLESTNRLTKTLKASGSVGKLILDALVREARFHVTVLTRSSSTAIFPTDITTRKTDYSAADLIKAFAGQDAVISVVGLSGFTEQKSFIDAAISAGVKRFIPSEFSSNTLSPAVLQLLPIFAQKKEVLDYLKEKEGSGLTWTAIWPALLFDSVSVTLLLYFN